jgi:photosystem II stability/assembly factor-like uncharacterized protein
VAVVALVSLAAVMLLAGASYARGAPAASFSLSPSAIQINPKRPNIVYASTVGDDIRQAGVFKSSDGGKTWSVANTGLTAPPGWRRYAIRVDDLALDARSPNVLYAATGLGVFKTSNGAKTWKLASNGIDLPTGYQHRLLEGSIEALAIDPMHRSTVYATNLGGVWKTTNGGVTWRNVLPRHFVYFGSLAIDPRRPKTVYASASATTPRESIYKSVDGGGSWRATGPDGLRGYLGGPIVVDRRQPATVYAGGARGLSASANGGRTWSRLLSLQRPRPFDGVTIALDPSRANVLYVGTTHGIMKSEDGGQTWSAPRLAGRSVGDIAIAPTQPQTIYAGGDGIWKSRDGGTTWHRLTR